MAELDPITSNSDDTSADFMAEAINTARSNDVSDMEDWLQTVNAGGQPPVAAPGVVDGGQGAPPAKPLVRKTDDSLGRLTGEESKAGMIMRNIAEVVPAASKGVNDAVMNATSFLSPLANWLDENVVDLSIDGVFEDPKTPTGMLVKGGSQFLTGFIPVMKAMKSSGMITNTFKAGTGAGAIADLAVWNGQEGRLADVWNKAGLPKNVLTDFLASDPSDSAMEARAKTALEGAGFGSILTGGIMLAAKAMRAIRPVGKAVKDEQKALEAKYGTMTDEEQKQFLGDPDGELVEVKGKEQPVAALDGGSPAARPIVANTIYDKPEAAHASFENKTLASTVGEEKAKAIREAILDHSVGGSSGNTKQTTAVLDDAIVNNGVELSADTTLYRGVDMTADEINKLKKLVESGKRPKLSSPTNNFTSTSFDRGVADSFGTMTVEIKLPSGVKVLPGSAERTGATDAEKEFILDRGLKLKLTAVRQEGDKTIFTGEYVDSKNMAAMTGAPKARKEAPGVAGKIEAGAEATEKLAPGAVIRGKGKGKEQGGPAKSALDYEVYHGTTRQFDEFDEARIGENYDDQRGMFFSSDPDEADLFAGKHPKREDSPNIRPSRVISNNPLRINAKGDPTDHFDENSTDIWAQFNKGKHDAIEITGKDGKKLVVVDDPKLVESRFKDSRGAVKGVKGSVLPEDFEVKINFARIDAPEQVKFTIGKMAEAMKPHIDEAKRGTITQEETGKLAADLGMSVPDLLARRKGQAFNAEEALAARNLWAASGTKLLELAKTAARKNAGPLDQFAFRRAMAVHAAIQAEVLGARAEMGRGLASWSIKSKGKTEQLRAIEQIMQASGGAEAASEMARRLSILAEEGASPAAIGRFAQRGWGAKSMDAVKEVWVNGLLSNPVTHAVNITSNTLVAFQSIYERLAAAGIRQFLGGTGSAGGEATAMAFGMVESLKDAFRMAAKTLRTGETGHEFHKMDLNVNRAVSSEAFNMSRETGMGRAVDFIGSVIRVPGRLLATEDEFFKTIGYRMEVKAQALRQATQEGHRGKDLAKRVQELTDDPPEFIRINSADAALYRTFTSEMGAFGKAVMNLRNIDHPLNPLPFILPFLRTPVNIARYAFERTPFAPLVSQWRADIAAGGARADLALAKMATGTAIMTVALDLADSGMISGQGPMQQDKDVREAMLRQGWQPYSIKVGDRWYSYNRMDPFGMTVGFAASIAETVRRGEIDDEDVDEWNEVTAMSIAAVAQVSISKTYLQGFAKFIEVMSDPQRHSQRYVSDLVASFLPFTALSSGVKNMVDPIQRETGTPAEAVYARIAGLSEQLPPRRNLWGEPLTSSSGLGKLYDFTSPVKSKEQVDSPIDRELVRLDAGPLRITKKTSFDGVPVNMKMFPQAYDDYVRLAGNDYKSVAHGGLGAKDYLTAVVSGKHPLSIVYNMGSDESRRDFIRSTISDFRQYAQQQVLADPKHKAFAAQVQAAKDHEFNVKMPVLEQ